MPSCRHSQMESSCLASAHADRMAASSMKVLTTIEASALRRKTASTRYSSQQCWADVTDSAGSDDDNSEGEQRLSSNASAASFPAARGDDGRVSAASLWSSRAVECPSAGLSMQNSVKTRTAASPSPNSDKAARECRDSQPVAAREQLRNNHVSGGGRSKTGGRLMVHADEVDLAEASSRGNPAMEAAPGRQSSPRSRARSAASSSLLNPLAPDFVPTLSMFCPLVGMCVLSPLADGVTTAQAAGLHGQEFCENSAFTDRHLEPPPVDNVRISPGVLPEAPEEIWRHREQVRRRELATLEASVLNSNDRRPMEQLKDLMLPAKPDPSDRGMSRRQWKKATNQWVKAMFSVVCLEHGAGSSVASTEDMQECQSSTTLSTSCDGSSDCGEKQQKPLE